jgi:hypothetical protein
MQRIIKVLLLSIVLGLVGLGASSTLEPWGVFQGFPFAYSYPNPITCMPNPLNGCGYSYDPVMIVLDYLFWLGTAVVGVSVISMLWNRLAPRRGASQPTTDQTPPGKPLHQVISPRLQTLSLKGTSVKKLARNSLRDQARACLRKIAFGSTVDLGFRSELLAPDMHHGY